MLCSVKFESANIIWWNDQNRGRRPFYGERRFREFDALFSYIYRLYICVYILINIPGDMSFNEVFAYRLYLSDGLMAYLLYKIWHYRL